MIEIAGRPVSWEDPAVLAGAGVAAIVLALLILLTMAVVRAGRAARAAAPLAAQVGWLAQRVQALGDGQQHLAGGLSHLGDTQAASQARMLELMENRLAQVGAGLSESVTGSSTRTARALGVLEERLQTIDRAQERIARLSGDVLSLQDILSNKQARGAFGEIQLRDVVAAALPPDAWTWQATLSNGRRVDCLIRLPHPPGPIAVDAKFPLESYEALRAAGDDRARTAAARQFRTAVKRHVADIAERYIVAGETAEGAMMFLPSEAVYAELHGNFGDVVREGFARKVWIVSPTTCMATLTTLRAALTDVRLAEHAAEIRTALKHLSRDLELVVARADKLENHFDQVRRDVEGVSVAAARAGRRAARIDALDFAPASPRDEVRSAETAAPNAASGR
ncbi:DNA recombination protein RmuC [Rhodobacteraceae bacterium CCMM004]|nr:DNA recombination protein RmuC [Rhodobacteraceae bacterium CCMM004]